MPTISTLGAASAHAFGFTAAGKKITNGAIKQYTVIANGSASYTSAAFPSAVTPGNLLIAFVEGQTSTAISGGATWNALGTSANTSTNLGAAHSKIAGSSEPTAYTVNTGSYGAVVLIEIENSSNTIGSFSGVTGVTANSYSIPSLSTGVSAGAITLVFGWYYKIASITISSPYSFVGNTNTSSGGAFLASYTNTTGTSPSGTVSGFGSEGNLMTVNVY